MRAIPDALLLQAPRYICRLSDERKDVGAAIDESLHFARNLKAFSGDQTPFACNVKKDGVPEIHCDDFAAEAGGAVSGWRERKFCGPLQIRYAYAMAKIAETLGAFTLLTEVLE